MEPKNKDEQPLIDIKGTEGLNFKGFKKPGQAGEEAADKRPPAGTGEGEENEEILTLEEMKERFPKLRVKIAVAGEEKILAPEELGQHYQLTHGRERTIEQRNQESARLQEETRRLHAEALEMRGDGKKKADDESPTDPDDPVVLIDGRVIGVIDAKVTPQMEALSRKVDALIEAVEPTIEDAQAKKAKSILTQRGIDDAGFDDYRQTALDEIGQRLGRELTAAEVAKIPGKWFADQFTTAVAAGHIKPKVAKKAAEELPEGGKRTVKVTTVGAGGGSGGGGFRPPTGSEDQSFKRFVSGTREDRASHLIKKGIRPYGSQGG